MKRVALLLLAAFIVSVAVAADSMTIVDTLVDRDGFDVFDVTVDRGGAVTVYNVTLPEMQKELEHQRLIDQFVGAEIDLRLHEEDTAAVIILRATALTVADRLKDLTYAIDLAENI